MWKVSSKKLCAVESSTIASFCEGDQRTLVGFKLPLEDF
jgi:hypothetical protein